MVDYVSVLEKHYPEVGFGLEDNSYNSIQFEYGEVPSKEHLDVLWTEMELDVIREKRNKIITRIGFHCRGRLSPTRQMDSISAGSEGLPIYLATRQTIPRNT